MASFSVSASLLLNEKDAVKGINKTNAALKRLFATAKSMKNMDLGLNTRTLGRAEREIRNLTRSVSNLQQAARRPITIAINTSRAQQQIQRLRQQASQSVTMGVGATGRNAGYSFGRDMGLGFRAAIGNEIFQFAKRAVVEGATATDVSDTRLALQQLSATDEAAARSAIQDILKRQQATPSKQLLNEAQTQSLLTEALGVTRGDVGAAKLLTEELTTMIKLGVAQGQTLDAALEGAINFGKAGEQMGKFTDSVTGAFDPRGMAAWFELQRKTMPSIGKEYTGQFVRMLTQGLRSSKYPLTPEAFVKGALLQEENTSTGVGINQLVKNLTGGTDVKTMLNQMMAGLIETEQVGKKTMWRGTFDEDALRENPAQWINDYVIPAMKKQGFDPASATDATKFASLIASDRTARETLTAMIIRNQELEAQAKQILARSGTTATTEQILKDSATLRFAAFGAQAENVAGNAIRALEPIIVPAMDRLNQSLADMAQGKVSPAKAATAAAAALATTTMISGASSLMSQITGISALTSGDPTTKVLGAIAVNTANTATGVAAIATGMAVGGGKGALGLLGLLGRYAGPATAGGTLYGLAISYLESLKRPEQRAGEYVGGLVGPEKNYEEMWKELRRKPDWTDLVDRTDERAYRRSQMEELTRAPDPLTTQGIFANADASLEAAFTAGGTTIAASMTGAAPTVGSSIMSAMMAGAAGMGNVIGGAAAARISSAQINVRYAAAPTAPDTGAQTVIQ
ncbi:hypothetical protein RB623_06795 [Mesorhizobium sp. LHD-90]|uniref:hypothetical protein n=1 Tax=Mesorhizobium sp. LHD-90 TaxID=3071414 RepID=UPI0027E03BE0|nr:hypothetical protein [Mesorhizobium sp. LHD-90]MDQ6433758.1 hypothetical protein [Mesorhizobium sp. LHD-90]